jgi:hypothetical protein
MCACVHVRVRVCVVDLHLKPLIPDSVFLSLLSLSLLLLLLLELPFNPGGRETLFTSGRLNQGHRRLRVDQFNFDQF